MQPLELRARRGEEKVALVALRVAGTVKLGAGRTLAKLDIVAGGKRVRLEWKPEHTYEIPKEGSGK